MKKFIIKGILMALPLLGYYYYEPIYAIITQEYKTTVAGNEIYVSINKSKQKKDYKKLIIGESVANQLFPNTESYESINSLACNQAIGVVGHYLLLKNYTEAGNKLDTVFMIYNPFSFRYNLNDLYTYHYFIKPFFRSAYKKELTKTVFKQVRKIPYFFLAHEPNILTSNWAPEYVSEDAVNYTFLSPIAKEYLLKIKDLSLNNNFELVILPTPTKISNKTEVESLNKSEYENTPLNEEFERYFSNIAYYNDSCFLDNVHLKRPNKFRSFYKNWITIKDH